MYGIFTYMYHINQPNVGKYTIHGWYGVVISYLSFVRFVDFVNLLLHRQRLGDDSIGMSQASKDQSLVYV